MLREVGGDLVDRELAVAVGIMGVEQRLIEVRGIGDGDAVVCLLEDRVELVGVDYVVCGTAGWLGSARGVSTLI